MAHSLRLSTGKKVPVKGRKLAPKPPKPLGDNDINHSSKFVVEGPSNFIENSTKARSNDNLKGKLDKQRDVFPVKDKKKGISLASPS